MFFSRVFVPFALGYFISQLFRSVIAVVSADLIRELSLDAWTVGFLTTEVEHRLPMPGSSRGESSVPVFLPTTPNPTSGWMVLVPTADLRLLDMTVEEGIKLVVSGGIVGPSNLGTLVREWDAGVNQ